ncbi:MAG TPA: hypothetical protein VFI22_09435 [Thermomicrobiales bacterium]|nr:hypothetical protein [Thermomicrobiales bacterium]
MRTEKTLWTFAAICAIALLFAPFTPRTMWLYDGQRPEGQAFSIRDSSGWDWLVPVLGVAAIVVLFVAALLRPRVVLPTLGAVLAARAFGIAAVAAGRYWLDLTRGAAAIEDYRIVPAPGPPFFTVVAIAGAAYALALAVSWLSPGDGEW